MLQRTAAGVAKVAINFQNRARSRLTRQQYQMIETFHRIRESPFGVNPDPRFFYLSRTHREAFSSLLYRTEMNSGFLAMVAQPGMGKTTLLFRLLQQLQSSTKTAFIFQTQCTSNELLRNLLAEFGHPIDTTDSVRIGQELKSILAAEARAGRRCVLIVDEAQNLGLENLETIRLLSNFETPQRKLLNIILSGQSEFGEMMALPALRQLRQRLSCIVRLESFSPGETVHYIAHRLAVAGYSGHLSQLFTVSALEKIAELSEGVPRVINTLCFNALSLTYAMGARQICLEVIEEAASDLGISDGPKKSFDEHTANAREIEDAILELTTACISTHSEAKASAEENKELPEKHSGPVAAAETIKASAISVGSKRRVHESGSESVLARGLVCLLVLFLTPAIDRPTPQSVAAKSIESSSNAPAIPKAVHFKVRSKIGMRRKYVERSDKSYLRRAQGRGDRSFTPLQLSRRAPVDLSLATFVPEPLLRTIPLKPMPLSETTLPSINPTVFPPSEHPWTSSHDNQDTSIYVPPKPIWQSVPMPPSVAWNEYPDEDVQLVLFISRRGEVSDVGILKGRGALALAAKRAAESWRYHPARAGGRPVRARIVVTVHFRSH